MAQWVQTESFLVQCLYNQGTIATETLGLCQPAVTNTLTRNNLCRQRQQTSERHKLSWVAGFQKCYLEQMICWLSTMSDRIFTNLLSLFIECRISTLGHFNSQNPSPNFQLFVWDQVINWVINQWQWSRRFCSFTTACVLLFTRIFSKQQSSNININTFRNQHATQLSCPTSTTHKLHRVESQVSQRHGLRSKHPTVKHTCSLTEGVPMLVFPATRVCEEKRSI